MTITEHTSEFSRLAFWAAWYAQNMPIYHTYTGEPLETITIAAIDAR